MGDVFCTAAGNNSNNGLTPATPVASLTGLFSLYPLNPGDTVYVDTGAYQLVRNLVLGTQFSGVRIIGAGDRVVNPIWTAAPFLQMIRSPSGDWAMLAARTAVDATGNGYNGTYIGTVTPDPTRRQMMGLRFSTAKTATLAFRMLRRLTRRNSLSRRGSTFWGIRHLRRTSRLSR